MPVTRTSGHGMPPKMRTITFVDRLTFDFKGNVAQVKAFQILAPRLSSLLQLYQSALLHLPFCRSFSFRNYIKIAWTRLSNFCQKWFVNYQLSILSKLAVSKTRALTVVTFFRTQSNQIISILISLLVHQNAVCLADVDNDGEFELVIGNSAGELAIFKGAGEPHLEP